MPGFARRFSVAPPRELRRLLGFVAPYRLRMAGAMLSLLAASLCGLALPQVLRRLIDAALVRGSAQNLDQVMLLLVAAVCGQVVFGFFRTYLLTSTGERIIADIRLRLCRSLLGQSAAFFVHRPVGELTSRVASDVSMLSWALTGCLTELLRQGFVLIGSIVLIGATNLRLTLVMLSVIPVVAVAATLVYGGQLRRISAQVQDSLAEASGVLEEALTGIRIVQSFVRESHEQARYERRIRRAVGLTSRRALVAGLFSAFAILVVFLGLAGVLWVGSRMVVSGELTTGALSAFVLYMFVVAFTVSGMVDQYGTFQQAIGSARRVFELLDAEPEIQDPPTPVALGRVEGRVRIENVSVRYGDDGAAALEDIDLEVAPGEVVALVGPSGAGKTSLVSLIPRFFDATVGVVRVDGHDVRTLRLSDLREAIALVPQETQLFGGTIRENIAYGDLDATPEQIEAAARAANAHPFIVELPDGYDSVVGQRGATLSGGQRQRIAIARALLKDPAILILDEATSALDAGSERLVQDALEVLMRGRTTFVIAHRLTTVRQADRIVVLDKGRIVAQGTHASLLADDGLYRQLHDLALRDPTPAAEDA